MQFTGALPDQLRFLGINPADQFLEKGPGGVVWLCRSALRVQNPFVITADGIQRQRPRVAFIRDRALKEGDDGRLRLRPTIFNRAEKCGNIGELRALSQKTGHFNVRVHAILQLAIQLQEIFVFEEHRRIALLGAQDLRRRGAGFCFTRKSIAR